MDKNLLFYPSTYIYTEVSFRFGNKVPLLHLTIRSGNFGLFFFIQKLCVVTKVFKDNFISFVTLHYKGYF